MREFDYPPRPASPLRLPPVFVIVGLLLLLLLGSRSIAGFVIEYQWRSELNQVDTWFSILSYGVLPVALGALIAFAVLWVAHARGLKSAGSGLGDYPGYAKFATVAALLLGLLVSRATVDGWAVVRYAGSRGLAFSGYRDPVFGNGLPFYFFDLPFYRNLLGYVLAVSLAAAVVYWLTSRFWRIRSAFEARAEGDAGFEVQGLDLAEALGSVFVRGALGVFLLALAVRFYLDRYDLLTEDRGSVVGIDWVGENLVLPLIWLKIAAAVLGAAALWAGRARLALLLPVVLLASAAVPAIVHAVYVRPSEITVQRPFIERHIEGTRAAYALNARVTEVEFPARQDSTIRPAEHRALLDNVRLWDWRAFHDTVTQIQALRPYYVFNDSDVDRYMIDGQLRQVLLAPRELDVRMLSGDARARWINPHFIYTHGYGLVMAEAAKINAQGLPVLLVQDAPPSIKTNSIKISQPAIYFGELTHDPVFVRTRQPEFDYPSGGGNVETRYQGKGGFPISSPLLRLAAAVSLGDWNILLTSYLAEESRMMLRRNVRQRLDALAGFIDWDDDPYLVVTEAGRLIWVVDGYTTSNAHPYARSVSVSGLGSLNYVRNSVKATVDAYDGNITIYAFDGNDPVLASYRQLLPDLFTDASRLPEGLRAHLRYPEKIFRIQAEIYRTYHMTDPEAFFNKEDLWDLARSMRTAGGAPAPVDPAYIIASLPGRQEAEFLLMTTFTPRGKENLIGIMMARCDGEALGELVFLQLSKQALIYGPLQISAQVNQDQNISKDLSLWNQQGSEVLRGHQLVLPVEDTVVYIEPIYLQASSAKMPQLKKVIVATGNRLIYADSYEQALAVMSGDADARAEAQAPKTGQTGNAPAAPLVTTSSEVIEQVKSHLRRYRELMSEGKYADAGKEMETIERLLERSR